MNKNDVIALGDLVEIIRKEGSITKGMLYKKSNLSIWKYKELRPYLVELFEDIKYDRKKLRYISISCPLSLFSQEDMK